MNKSYMPNIKRSKCFLKSLTALFEHPRETNPNTVMVISIYTKRTMVLSLKRNHGQAVMINTIVLIIQVSLFSNQRV